MDRYTYINPLLLTRSPMVPYILP